MKLKRLIAGVVSAAMMLSIGSTLAFAAEGNVDYTSGVMTFDSVMNLSEDAISAPNVTYTYTIAGMASPNSFDLDGKTTSYITGVTTGITSSDTGAGTTEDLTAEVAFTTSDYASKTSQVSKTAYFDFSEVEYAEPGVYVYTITEENNAGSLETLINEDETRYVYVTVKNATTSTASLDTSGDGFVIGNIIMTLTHIEEVTVDDSTGTKESSTETEKSSGYLHSYGVAGGDSDDPGTEPDEPAIPGDPGDTSVIANYVIDLTTRGDMANAGKYFDFTVAVDSGVDTGTIFKVLDPDSASGATYITYYKGDEVGNDAGLYFITLTYDGDGECTDYTLGDAFAFDLKNGQEYIIYSVSTGVSFSTEIEDKLDAGYDFYSRLYEDAVDTDWTTANPHVGTTDDNATDEGSSFVALRGADDDEGDDNKLDFDAAFPETGVVLDLLPYVVMVALAGAFIAFRVVKSARKDEE